MYPNLLNGVMLFRLVTKNAAAKYNLPSDGDGPDGWAAPSAHCCRAVRLHKGHKVHSSKVNSIHGMHKQQPKQKQKDR